MAGHGLCAPLTLGSAAVCGSELLHLVLSFPWLRCPCRSGEGSWSSGINGRCGTTGISPVVDAYGWPVSAGESKHQLRGSALNVFDVHCPRGLGPQWLLSQHGWRLLSLLLKNKGTSSALKWTLTSKQGAVSCQCFWLLQQDTIVCSQFRINKSIQVFWKHLNQHKPINWQDMAWPRLMVCLLQGGDLGQGLPASWFCMGYSGH